jgi:hypothetical protein
MEREQLLQMLRATFPYIVFSTVFVVGMFVVAYYLAWR